MTEAITTFLYVAAIVLGIVTPLVAMALVVILLRAVLSVLGGIGKLFAMWLEEKARRASAGAPRARYRDVGGEGKEPEE